ncbi:MAG: hypothetical protein LRY69_00015 [Gammaproteobacteria bacterium]|nr:hypothetical protein [Gammaproteobacteria bacterium]
MKKKKSNQEIGNESETARLLEQEKMLDKFYEFYLKPKARYNYGCYNGIDGLFSGCTICSILEIDEGKPRSNNVYLTIDENDEIKYRTAFTPGSNYILLNNLSLENKRSLSTAIKDQNLMSVSQDCKEEVIDVVCRAGHVLNGVLTNIRKTLVADKRQSILDLVKFFSPCEENKVLDILVRDIGSLFDFPYNQTRASDPNIENKLPKLVARHLLFMFHAFPGLRILSEDDKEKMIKNFLDKTVLADNKWNCYPSYGVETLYTALKPFIKMEDYTLCDPTDMLRANLTGSSPTAFAISMG